MVGNMFFTSVAIFVIFGLGAYGNIDSSEGPSRETAVSDLPQLVGNEEGILQLFEEFSGIKGGHRRPWTVAQLPENINKNRYYEDNLLAFDHSRVILEKLPNDPYSDYINANYIDGQNSEKEYVATQGPLPNTLNDFWRMIWQLNVTKIVMLANVIEHNEIKVVKYWPESSDVYGDIEVTNMLEFPVAQLQHVVRTFSVKKSGIARPRIVRQFHFTGWPDLGVPKDTLPVVSLIRQAKLYDRNNEAPIVVHCSAGIGRTGTVILLDSMIQKGKADGMVGFPKRLDHMRTQRPDMVEKKEQYVFAHQAVSDVFNDPNMDKKLKAVEDTYRLMDIEMDAEELAFSKDLRQDVTKVDSVNQPVPVNAA